MNNIKIIIKKLKFLKIVYFILSLFLCYKKAKDVSILFSSIIPEKLRPLKIAKDFIFYKKGLDEHIFPKLYLNNRIKKTSPVNENQKSFAAEHMPAFIYALIQTQPLLGTIMSGLGILARSYSLEKTTEDSKWFEYFHFNKIFSLKNDYTKAFLTGIIFKIASKFDITKILDRKIRN